MWFRRITLIKHVKRAQAELPGQRINVREADVHREEESEDEDEIQDFRRVQIVKKGVSVGHFPSETKSLGDHYLLTNILEHRQIHAEFFSRLQQYVDLVRTQEEDKLLGAINFARKYLYPFKEDFPDESGLAACLLTFPKDMGTDPLWRQLPIEISGPIME